MNWEDEEPKAMPSSFDDPDGPRGNRQWFILPVVTSLCGWWLLYRWLTR